ncbi:MAG: Ig-like domain-containing protein, partial [Clostridia bacterium]|nr:Ig-like domain-containing protein [Clostridia bacterium]
MDSYADRYAEKYGIPRIYITDLILSETYLDLSVGSLYTLTYNITPESSKDQSVTWTSDDPSVVTVENGLLRAKDKGKAVITAVTDDGTYEQCTVNVYREVIHQEAVPPTCTEDGTLECWIYENKYYLDEKLTQQVFSIIDPAIGHDWGEPEYTWDDEYNCTALRICNHDHSHVETETTAGICSVSTQPTCECDGEGEYYAVFKNPAFSEQIINEIIPAKGHDWGEPEWTWNGYKTAYAVFTCTNDNTHTETVNAEITSKTNAPTCETDGKTVYTATVTFNGKTYTDTKTEIIPKTGHDWGEPEWTWESYDTAYAVFTCTNDTAHKETVKAEITSETTPATEETEGKIVYTATVEFEGKVYTDTKTEIIPKIETDDEPIRYGDVNDDG